MTKNEMTAFRRGRLVGHLVLVMMGFTTVALAVNAFIPKYRASYSAEFKTLVVNGPNGNRIDLVGFIESTNTPMYIMYNVGFLRQYQHEAVTDFTMDVLAAAAMNPVYDTNSALAVSEAFFRVANKRNAAAIRDVEDFMKGEIHE